MKRWNQNRLSPFPARMS